jgi:hypothetical protein
MLGRDLPTTARQISNIACAPSGALDTLGIHRVLIAYRFLLYIHTHIQNSKPCQKFKDVCKIFYSKYEVAQVGAKDFSLRQLLGHSMCNPSGQTLKNFLALFSSLFFLSSFFYLHLFNFLVQFMSQIFLFFTNFSCYCT